VKCPQGRSHEGIEHGEADSSTQELAALVEHALLDYLVRPQEHGPRDRQPERLSSLQIDHQLELSGLLNGEVAWLCP
jgi:hypothetical protein